MKKKILALCLVVVLAVTAVTGATLAYFTDDEQVTNTMTIGNIEINIDEYTYMADEEGNRDWAAFEDDKFVLYPIDNAQGTQLWNKMVYTANTSPSKDDAYIRNIVLIEANDNLPADYENEGDCCFPGIHYSFATNDTAVSSTDNKTYTGSKEANILSETVTIGNEEYWVVVFEQKNGEAIPSDAALYTLSGVWMDKNITSEQIAGWGTDNKVNVIVFSQGIQAEGLTHTEAMEALGEVNETNLQSWIGADDAVVNDWTNK